jgi:hypothetical protein
LQVSSRQFGKAYTSEQAASISNRASHYPTSSLTRAHLKGTFRHCCCVDYKILFSACGFLTILGPPAVSIITKIYIIDRGGFGLGQSIAVATVAFLEEMLTTQVQCWYPKNFEKQRTRDKIEENKDKYEDKACPTTQTFRQWCSVQESSAGSGTHALPFCSQQRVQARLRNLLCLSFTQGSPLTILRTFDHKEYSNHL